MWQVSWIFCRMTRCWSSLYLVSMLQTASMHGVPLHPALLHLVSVLRSTRTHVDTQLLPASPGPDLLLRLWHRSHPQLCPGRRTTALQGLRLASPPRTPATSRHARPRASRHARLRRHAHHKASPVLRPTEQARSHLRHSTSSGRHQDLIICGRVPRTGSPFLLIDSIYR